MEKYLPPIILKAPQSSPRIFWKRIAICDLRWLNSRPDLVFKIDQLIDVIMSNVFR